MKKYSIVIPTYNHCNDFLAPCIDSILRNSNLNEIEICVSANGCTDNTLAYLHSMYNHYPGNIKWAWSQKPLGYARSTNRGIEIAEGEFVVLLNNDTTVLDHNKNGWLERLRKPFDEDIDMGVTGLTPQFSPIMNRNFLIFFCVMMRRNLFTEIGLLDEDFKVGGSEDMEFCYRAELKGYKIKSVLGYCKPDPNSQMMVTDFPLWHMGEGTAHDKELVKIDLQENSKKNDELLFKKTRVPVPELSNRPKIVLKHTYPGLGDNLAHSTLPEIYTKKGYDVYVSLDQGYRNDGVKQLIDMNPFIKGHTARPHNFNIEKFLKNTYPINHENKNYQARLEQAVFGEIHNNYPKIYYTPIFLPEWQDKTFIDFTTVTVQDHPVDKFVEYALSNNDNCVRVKHDYWTKSIFEYINIVYSCKKFICTYTGSMVLASAINKRNVECYATSEWINKIIKSAYFFHYDNVNYIAIDKYEDSIINVKEN